MKSISFLGLLSPIISSQIYWRWLVTKRAGNQQINLKTRSFCLDPRFREDDKKGFEA